MLTLRKSLSVSGGILGAVSLSIVVALWPWPTATAASPGATSAPELGTWILSVQVVGEGNVTSSPGTINCGSLGASCTNQFADGTPITLSAIAEPGSDFIGWGGDPPCATGTFAISADTACIASFDALSLDDVFTDGFESDGAD